MNSDEIVRVAALIATIVVSFTVSDFVVDALSQIASFMAWIAIGIVLWAVMDKLISFEGFDFGDIISAAISFVISAIIVIFWNNIVLALVKICITLILTYVLLKLFMPDVIEDLIDELKTLKEV